MRTDTLRPVALRLAADRTLRLGDWELFTDGPYAVLAAILRATGERGAHLVVTPNVNQMIDLERDRDLRDAYSTARLRLLDGQPLVLLARALGARGVHRNTGADLLQLAAREAPSYGWRVSILGGGPGVAQVAAKRLAQAFGADVAGIDIPMMRDVADRGTSSDAIAALHARQSHLVFLCFGSPKQEKWFTHWRADLPDGVYIGAGGAADFAAGRRRRAPVVVQRLAAEWIWRLAGEPRRLAGRYLGKGPRFLVIAGRSVRHRPRSAVAESSADHRESVTSIEDRG